ncbi:MAG: polar amino acid transport system substrate-binding protein [Parasphingorhabdus sp.]|jgi:polar amino acid transport system substrate-binding protein
MNLIKVFALTLLTSTLFVSSYSYARNITGVTTEWAPHYGSVLEDGGALTVITREAFKRKGHSANVNFIPWNRALKDVVDGKEDFVMGAYYNQDRAKAYIMSDPIYAVEVVLVALDTISSKTYKGLDDLRPFTIGVSRGYANSEEFDGADFLTKEAARNPMLNLRKLFRNRLDIVAGARDIILYEARKEDLNTSRMIVLQPPLKSNDLYLMASRSIPDGQRIIDDFNSALAEMRADGTYDAILGKYLSR